jgi:flagella basal body P-ring formation protein FlgA
VKGDVPRGSLLSAEDIEFISRDITFCAPGFFSSKEDLIGSKTVVTINAGTTIQRRMVCKIPDITSGDNVKIIYNKGRIRCSVIGVARESGHTGEKIWVQNNETQQLIRVKILSKGVVEIA